jgi:hypothetical protein
MAIGIIGARRCAAAGDDDGEGAVIYGDARNEKG